MFRTDVIGIDGFCGLGIIKPPSFCCCPFVDDPSGHRTPPRRAQIAAPAGCAYFTRLVDLMLVRNINSNIVTVVTSIITTVSSRTETPLGPGHAPRGSPGDPQAQYTG